MGGVAAEVVFIPGRWHTAIQVPFLAWNCTYISTCCYKSKCNFCRFSWWWPIHGLLESKKKMYVLPFSLWCRSFHLVLLYICAYTYMVNGYWLIESFQCMLVHWVCAQWMFQQCLSHCMALQKEQVSESDALTDNLAAGIVHIRSIRGSVCGYVCYRIM